MIDVILKKIKEEGKQGWNLYRDYYDLLTFEDLVVLNDKLDELFPNQNHFNEQVIKGYFDQLVSEELFVLELGCHVGNLAKTMLREYSNVTRWTGLDISKSVIKRTIVRDIRYFSFHLETWFFETKLPIFNVFISTHTLEHMRLTEVFKCLKHVDPVTYMILEIPLSKNRWYNYGGTHILDANKDTLKRIFTELGYDCKNEVGDLLIFLEKKKET